MFVDKHGRHYFSDYKKGLFVTEDDIHNHMYQNQFYNPQSNKHLRGNKDRSLVWFKDGDHKVMVLYSLEEKVPKLLEIDLVVEGGIQDMVPYQTNKLFVVGRGGHIYLLKFEEENLDVVWETQVEKRVSLVLT